MSDGRAPTAADAALAGRSTPGLRKLAGVLVFSGVLATLLLPQPEAIDRWAVVAITVAALALLPLVRLRFESRWEQVGPWLALTYVGGLVLLTGGAESLYVDVVAVVIAITALVRSARRTAVVVAAAAGVALLPALVEPVPSHFLTDVAIDAVVWAALGVLILQQSQGLRQHAADLATEKAETERLLAQEHRVTEALRELQEARATFTRNITHELRTPLTVLRGHIQMLESGLVQADELPSVVQAMRRAYDRLETLLVRVEGIYSLTDEALDRREVPVAGLLRRAVGAHAHVPDVLDLPPDELTAVLDPVVAAAIVTELLTNVAQHAGADAPTRVRAAIEQGALVVELSDGGPGWDGGDDPALLLAPFQQGQQAARRANPGVGLGLAYVAAAARAHGGDVVVDTDPELGGARVRVVLVC